MSPWLPSTPTFPALIDTSRFMYDKDVLFTAHAAKDPPHNCTICARRGEEEMRAHGRIMPDTLAVTGVAVHKLTFHVGLYCVHRARPHAHCASCWHVFR